MEEKTLRKVFEHAEFVDNWCATHGGIRVMTALFGSQNYGTDNENSDMDTKSIIIPELRDWTWGDTKKYNTTLIMPDGSHAETKSLVDMCKQYIKGNINFIETLYTPYSHIASGWEWLYEAFFDVRENVCRHNLYKMAQTWLGYERQAIEHAFNSTSKSLGYRPEYGYNPKSLMNAFRIKESFIRFFQFDQPFLNRPFDEAIDVSDMKNYFLEIKENPMPLDIALMHKQDLLKWVTETKEYVMAHFIDKEAFNVDFYFKSLSEKVYVTLSKKEII